MKTSFTRHFFRLLIACMLPSLSFAQQAELQKAFAELKPLIQDVEAGKSAYAQEIELLDRGVLRYSYTETDTKGNTEEHAFEFNLADIDENTVRQETKRDLIMVNLSVKNAQKLIKEFEGGEVDAYTKEVAFLATDVDNARAIRDVVKKTIPPAEKLLENILELNSYEAMQSWLSEHVQTVEVGEHTYEQRLKPDTYVGSYQLEQKVVSPKKTEAYVYSFNLADVNPTTLEFNIKGNTFSLSFEALRRQKVFGVTKDGKPANYTHQIEIVTNNVEEARDLRTVLAKAIPLAGVRVKDALPKLNSQQEALSAVARLTTKIEDGDTQIEQSFTPACVATFSLQEQSAKGTSNSEYRFNLMDLNENELTYESSGTQMYVSLPTKAKAKMIQHRKDEQIAGYESELKIYVSNVALARELKHALEKAITFCRTQYKSASDGRKAQDKLRWITETVGEVRLGEDTYKQVLKPDAGDPNKIVLEVEESDSKKTTEEIYEFNLTDIDPRSIDYNVRGNVLSVKMETKGREKIIKYYQDSEIKPYASSLEIVVDDIEEARELTAALKSLIPELQK